MRGVAKLSLSERLQKPLLVAPSTKESQVIAGTVGAGIMTRQAIARPRREWSSQSSPANVSVAVQAAAFWAKAAAQSKFRDPALSATPFRSNSFAGAVLSNSVARLHFCRRTRCTSCTTGMTEIGVIICTEQGLVPAFRAKAMHSEPAHAHGAYCRGPLVDRAAAFAWMPYPMPS